MPLMNLVYLLIGSALLLCLVIAIRPRVEHSLVGRVLAFVAIVLVPVAAGLAGFDAHMERCTTVAFCLSCHPMEKYGRSLLIDDAVHIPASHYQYNRVPRETACFACHTNYTLFGDYKAKLEGLRHVWVEYLGTIPQPQDIKLYKPFNNRECLHCHEGARSFIEAIPHKTVAGGIAAIERNQVSCVGSGCHDTIHDLAHVDSLPQWSETK